MAEMLGLPKDGYFLVLKLLAYQGVKHHTQIPIISH